MPRFAPSLAAFALTAAAALPAYASSEASSASDSVSTSVGKSSDSLGDSSKSSSRDDARTARGDYRVAEIAEVQGRPDQVRLRLQPAEGQAGGEFTLTLPRAAAANGHVGQDSIVTALQRPYGIEFAAGRPHEAFFLALADDWARELQTTAVAL